MLKPEYFIYLVLKKEILSNTLPSLCSSQNLVAMICLSNKAETASGSLSAVQLLTPVSVLSVMALIQSYKKVSSTPHCSEVMVKAKRRGHFFCLTCAEREQGLQGSIVIMPLPSLYFFSKLILRWREKVFFPRFSRSHFVLDWMWAIRHKFLHIIYS